MFRHQKLSASHLWIRPFNLVEDLKGDYCFIEVTLIKTDPAPSKYPPPPPERKNWDVFTLSHNCMIWFQFLGFYRSPMITFGSALNLAKSFLRIHSTLSVFISFIRYSQYISHSLRSVWRGQYTGEGNQLIETDYGKGLHSPSLNKVLYTSPPFEALLTNIRLAVIGYHWLQLL